MKEMWEQTVHPAIRKHVGIERVICHRRIKCFGVGESQLESMLPDIIRRGRQPRVGITVHRATITLRVTAEGPNEPACFQLMEPTIKTIHECLGELIFGQEDDELEHAVMRQLQQQRRSLAVCEWGTRGILSRWLSEVEMPATPLKGAIVVQDAAALNFFGVTDAQTMNGNAAATAQLMAEKIRDAYNADYGLSVSDIPRESDSQRIFVGLAGPVESKVHSKSYAGHPDILLERAAKQALNVVRLNL
jgi:nicotinamide-nucleotide amidase